MLVMDLSTSIDRTLPHGHPRSLDFPSVFSPYLAWLYPTYIHIYIRVPLSPMIVSYHQSSIVLSVLSSLSSSFSCHLL